MLLKVGTLQIHRQRDRNSKDEYRTVKALEQNGFTLVLEDWNVKSDSLCFTIAYDKAKIDNGE